MPGDRLGLPVGGVSLTYNIYWQSDFLTDLTAYNASQKVKGYAMSDIRLNVQNIAKTNADFAFNVSNLFNRHACLAEPGGTGAGGGAGVLTSTPNSTFGTPGTSGIVQCVPQPPRMFFATAKYAF